MAQADSDFITTTKLRRRMERAVERLISALDALDFEDEREDDDPAEDNGDKEPSIASLGMNAGNQAFWADGTNDEREDEHDGTEPCEEGEPWLGSFDRMMHQEHSWRERAWWVGGDYEYDPAEREDEDEREHDPAERGIADRKR